MEVYTIGFTKKTAEEFFGELKKAKVRRLIDVRLHNTSQLAGFSKRDDLAYFVREICGAEYIHEPLFSPTEEMLKDYQKGRTPWDKYEPMFRNLLKKRAAKGELDLGIIKDRTVLLCAEPDPDHCHRRLVAEFIAEKLPKVRVVHL